jgi:tetratricopeptide (TPR) repeat protein
MAQDRAKIDSLKNELKYAKEDTNKVKLLLKLGMQYEYSIPDTAMFYNQKALNLSQKINLKKFIADCYLSFGIVHRLQGANDTALVYFHKTLKIRKELDDKKGISDCYDNIGIVHTDQGSYNKALEYYFKALKMAEEKSYKHGMSSILINIGNTYYRLGSYDKAIEYYSKALKIQTELGNKREISSCYNNLGNTYTISGSYDKALKYYFKALKIKEEQGNNRGMINGYNNIGIVHSSQGSYDKALEYYLKALKIAEEMGFKAGMLKCYNSIGSINIIQNSYDKALKYYFNALKIAEEIASKVGISESYNNIGFVYESLNSYEKALEYYFKALKIDEETGYKYGIANGYLCISGINITLYDSTALNKNQRLSYLTKAVEYGTKSINLAKEIGAIQAERYAATYLMYAYRKLGNYKKALEFADVYIEAKDSMFNEEKTKTIQEMQTKYETEKKEQQIVLQETELAKKDIEIKQQETVRKALIIGLGAFVLIIILVIYAYIQKRKSNIKITRQKDIIEEQKEEITASIHYAKRIQSAILPPQEMLNKALPDHFVLFKPKDIVSGDFYWMKQINNHTIITAVDCTGHGVPGAFMSMLGSAFLTEIVKNENITKASDILNELRNHIKTALRQEGVTGEAKDGMDMALCVIDHENMKMQFAGAYNPLYLIRKNSHDFELTEYKGDRMPIGIHLTEKDSFINNEIDLAKDDRFFIFSDGFADQFGGPDSKKFMSKNFRKLLLEIQDKPMQEQALVLDKTIEDWKASPDANGEPHEQMDDILVIGVRV